MRKTWRVLYEGAEATIDIQWNPPKAPLGYIRNQAAPLNTMQPGRQYSFAAFGRVFFIEVLQTTGAVSMQLLCNGNTLDTTEVYDLGKYTPPSTREPG